jgi:large subunit ribosomal protein L23
VKVTGVWTSNARGKQRRVGQSIGRRPHTKKAIVKLRDGDTIAIFEG